MRSTPQEQLTFADLELRPKEGSDRLFDAISAFLDRIPDAAELVRRDLRKSLRNPNTGRRGLGPDTVLRSLVLWRIKDYSYRELADRVQDGYALRRFVRLRGSPVPRHDAFKRAFDRLSLETVREITDLVSEKARDDGLDDGTMVRVDGTVVESDIHFPTDASLMWDVVRVLTRLVHRLLERAPPLGRGFKDRTKRSKGLFFRIQRPSRKTPKTATDGMYRELIGIAAEVVDAARVVAGEARTVVGSDIFDEARLQGLKEEIEQYADLGERVVDQARRRIILGERVPAREQVVSIFESHTDIIVRGKKGKPAEFGHKVVLAETATGLVFHHDVPDGSPSEQPWVDEALSRHREIFARAPKVFAADRGFYSKANTERCEEAEVEVEAIPYRGGKRSAERAQHERTPEFKAAQRFRNGVEGRISSLLRGRGMHRCRLSGRPRFAFFVAASILANNLMCLAEIIIEKEKEGDDNTAAA